ncbi:hypothetical protein LJC32_02630 [Oscillospiraceae bacterium OttesenSCG-928-F05]|nr:hypothetical protein [Oscillospiraceae bacterium OttesenSCG-928-F05]
MTHLQLIQKAKDIALNYKTVYMWGVFGAPVSDALIKQKAAQYPSHYSKSKQTTFKMLSGKGYFAFDCVCLIKAILWGWSGDASRSYGGAMYQTNGVPDIDANVMIRKCRDVSTDFKSISPGEVVWTQNHIGIYIGDGLAVEATPSWRDGVQMTACANLGTKSGYNSRRWEKHGFLPWVDYVKELSPEEVTAQNAASDGAINSPDYWVRVLRGEKAADSAYIKALMDGYHRVVTGLKK